ncbi:MAG: bestrophin family ion channel [Cyanobacteriota bacterium]|nr:bestrophin family ion channel [Cyanobacteriota bacterium]
MFKSKHSVSALPEERNWFRLLVQLRGSVVAAILPRVALCAGFSCFVSFLHAQGYPVYLPVLSGLVPAIVLGLLLVFRTNTAYERFWEGRKCWGGIFITGVNIASQMWVAVKEVRPEDREEKKAIARLLIAFAIASKHHLRLEPMSREIARFLPPQQFEQFQKMQSPPLQIVFLIRDYLQRKYEENCLNSYQLSALFELLDLIGQHLGACERILRTPVPLAYSIHLKQLLTLYCFTLPFTLVDDLQWWTAAVVSLISFTVFGIEEIGIEIENPFGYDANDLPLDSICSGLERDIEDLLSLDNHYASSNRQ